MAPEDRIGTTYIPVDSEKVVAIIESDYQDQTVANSPADATSQAIARHLIEFLEYEVRHDRLPKNLLPLQSGIGNIANAVIGGLAESNFEHLKVWTEVNCPCTSRILTMPLTVRRSCKIPFWISSILAVLILQLQLLSVSLQMDSNASTMAGSNTTTSSCSDLSKFLTLQRSFEG